MSTVFSENLRKFRLQKKLTQEQVAESLGATVQTVSRWECGNALPDVLRLPELANLYKNDGLEIEAEITREKADRVKAKMS